MNKKNEFTYPPFEMKVLHQPLTPEECEDLKEKVRDCEYQYEWGSYDWSKPNIDPKNLTTRTIANLDTQHLENLLITQPQLPNEHAAAILMLLRKRYKVTQWIVDKDENERDAATPKNDTADQSQPVVGSNPV